MHAICLRGVIVPLPYLTPAEEIERDADLAVEEDEPMPCPLPPPPLLEPAP